MLYLLIFASLAVGFYAAVTTAAQVAHNDERALRAQVAAESGLLYVQYELSRVSMPGNTPHDQVLEEVVADLRAQQARADQFVSRSIGFTPGTSLSPDVIEFPAGGDEFIPLDDGGAGFRATLTDLGHGDMQVKVVGRHRGVVIERAVQMNFRSVYKDLSIFDYGIVTRGNFDMAGSGRITGADPTHAHVLSTSRQSVPITLSGNVAIEGDAFMVNPDGQVDMTGRASIGGSRQTGEGSHIHRGVPEPEFPSIDTSVFLPYATNPYTPGQSLYRNVLVPPNTNPTFNSKVTIEGVLYIRHPNVVTFSGQSTVRGSIVVENGAMPGPSNAINFSGGATTYGMETLPESPYFPPGLRALRGSTLLAPGFSVTMTGHSGVTGGTMIADLFNFTGTSDRTVEGSMIALGNGPFRIRGNATINRTRPPLDEIPAGLNFTRTLKPIHDTYIEVRP